MAASFSYDQARVIAKAFTRRRARFLFLGKSGAVILDSSIGGLGGCPFAPNATGNIATEDLVYLLEEMGVETGVNLEALIEVSNWLEGVMGRGVCDWLGWKS